MLMAWSVALARGERQQVVATANGLLQRLHSRPEQMMKTLLAGKVGD